MDNFTHSMAGWVLGQTGLKKTTRKGLAALILGANMPDIDVFFGWVSWAPLATHRGFTHGLTGGVLLMPPLLAALLWLLDRWQVSRGQSFRSGLPMRFGWLVAMAYLGAITHPLLDLQNTYAVQLLSPFSTLWFHNDALFIIDVWVWSGVAFAIWMSRRREKHGGNWRAPALIGIAGFLAYLGANTALTLSAKQQLAAEIAPTRGAPAVMVASPQPALFWQRALVYRTEERDIGRGFWSPESGLALRPGLEPDNMDDPLAVRARTATPAIVDFMRWSFLTVAEVERKACKANVWFTDARYSDGPVRGNFRRAVELPLEGPGCSGDVEER